MTDIYGFPIRILLSCGNVHDIKFADKLIENLKESMKAIESVKEEWDEMERFDQYITELEKEFDPDIENIGEETIINSETKIEENKIIITC